MDTQPTQQLQVPVLPPPQTVEGHLYHTSEMCPADVVPLPGEKPDMEEHTSRLIYLSTFEVSKNDDFGKLYVEQEVLPHNTGTQLEYPMRPFEWYTANYAYFSADINFVLWAIKPPSVTGRLIVMYVPSFSGGFDDSQRTISKEWDLSETDVFTFGVNAPLTAKYRPTFINGELGSYGGFSDGLGEDGSGRIYYAQRCNTPNFLDRYFGKIQIKLAQKTQPGSIYPDAFNVHIFRSFKNFRAHTVTGLPMVQSSAIL